MTETGTDGFELIDIKKQNISEEDLETAKAALGSYENLFNKRAQKIKLLNLDLKSALESDFKIWILEEYTFLKRPVYFMGKKVFAGNDKATIHAIKLSKN